MKYFDLDKKERELLADYETGRLRKTANVDAEKCRLKSYTAATLNKTRNINIRLSEKDLWKIKAKAVDEGIPYQTLTSSVLHRFAYA